MKYNYAPLSPVGPKRPRLAAGLWRESLALRLRGLHLQRAAGLGTAMLVLLTATLVLTLGWSDQPTTPGIAREPSIPDYAVPLARESAEPGTVSFLAQTAFWALLPDSWRNSADWRLYLTGSSSTTNVHVRGEKVEPRTTDQSDLTFYAIPARLITTTTRILVSGQQTTNPLLYIHWNHSYLYPGELAHADDQPLLELDGTPVPVQTAGTQLLQCEPGNSSVTPIVKWCARNEKVVSLPGSGWAQSSLTSTWPNAQGSVSLWVKPAADGHFGLFSNEDDTTKNLSLNITLDGPGAILVFVSTNGVTRQVLVGNRHAPIGLWSHISVSFNERELKLYINGLIDGHIALDGPLHPASLPFVLGSSFSSPSRYYYALKGQMAGVRIRSTAIDPEAALSAFMSDAEKDPQGNLSLGSSFVSLSRGTQAPSAWWETHLAVASMVAAAYLALMGWILSWAVAELRMALRRKALIATISVAGASLLLASIFTTNFDVQLFKGEGEGYWVNGPLPALTLSGYGPSVDVLYTLPMLPYVLVSGLIGKHSELALNLAIRLPFIVGWLLLIASTYRLARLLRPSVPPTTLLSLLILNPVVLVVTLWQPEALLSALVVLSITFLFEHRPVVAGVILGIAFSGKFWPAVIGPVLAIAAWRLFGLREAARFVLAACATALGIMFIYWFPTLLILGSPSEFLGLLITRTPYFGGTHAAAEATIWSLYSFPIARLPDTFAGAMTTLESYSFIGFVVAYIAILVVCLRSLRNRRTTLLSAAAVLALLAGMSSLTVPQFGLWSLPLVLVVGIGRRGPSLLVWITLVATWCAAGVWVWGEPISYWLLHVSTAQDQLAYASAGWLQDHVINLEIARRLGFFFALWLTIAAVALIIQLDREPKRAATFITG